MSIVAAWMNGQRAREKQPRSRICAPGKCRWEVLLAAAVHLLPWRALACVVAIVSVAVVCNVFVRQSGSPFDQAAAYAHCAPDGNPMVLHILMFVRLMLMGEVSSGMC